MKKKYFTPEEALAAKKAQQKSSREKNLAHRQQLDRERYRSKHPGHKVYNKDKTEPVPVERTKCQFISLKNRGCRCGRNVKSNETLCWQHKPKPDAEVAE